MLLLLLCLCFHHLSCICGCTPHPIIVPCIIISSHTSSLFYMYLLSCTFHTPSDHIDTYCIAFSSYKSPNMYTDLNIYHSNVILIIITNTNMVIPTQQHPTPCRREYVIIPSISYIPVSVYNCQLECEFAAGSYSSNHIVFRSSSSINIHCD